MFTSTHRIYKHNHSCAREGEQISVRPICENGVEFVTVPICIEAGVELSLIHVDKYPIPAEDSLGFDDEEGEG
jgi:hypothetical protein